MCPYCHPKYSSGHFGYNFSCSQVSTGIIAKCIPICPVAQVGHVYLFLPQSMGASDVQVSSISNCVHPRKCTSTVSPCLNSGVCQDLDGSSFECQCTAGYYGSDCQFCTVCAAEMVPCRNNGTCELINASGRGYQCVCDEGFNGTNCDVLL